MSERDALHLVPAAPADALDDKMAAAFAEPWPVVDLAPAVERAVLRERRRRWPRALACLAAVLVVGSASFVVGRATTGVDGHQGAPVVMLMDTAAPRAVYDAQTVAHGGTNADDLNDLLRDLPVKIFKESLSSTWDREDQVLKLHPDVVLIHRSAFFHALNRELDLGYPPFASPKDDARWHLVYRAADDKLVALLGLLGAADAQTRFLVYSRGTGGGWTDAGYRTQWVDDVEKRFPALRGRVTTFLVPGGVDGGSFKIPAVTLEVREKVRALLPARR